MATFPLIEKIDTQRKYLTYFYGKQPLLLDCIKVRNSGPLDGVHQTKETQPVHFSTFTTAAPRRLVQ